MAWSLVRCPACRTTNNPLLGHLEPGKPSALPPIPDRMIVRCRYCGQTFYVVESQG